MPMGCLQELDDTQLGIERVASGRIERGPERPAERHPAIKGAPKTYTDTAAREADHTRFLHSYLSPAVKASRYAKRPWDSPAQQLNELGPNGYNYFRLTQTDELRRWHAGQLAQSKRSPLLRGKETVDALNGQLRYTPSILIGRHPNGELFEENSPPPMPRLSAPSPRHAHFVNRPASAATNATPWAQSDRLPMPTLLRMPKPSMAELMR
jgi:hypothetical protein